MLTTQSAPVVSPARVRLRTTAKRSKPAVSPFLVNDDTFLSTYGNALLLANKAGKGGRALAGRRTYQYVAASPRTPL